MTIDYDKVDLTGQLDSMRRGWQACEAERDALAAQNARLRAALEGLLVFETHIADGMDSRIDAARAALALPPPAALEELRWRERIATLREAAAIASQMEQEDDATAGAVWERLTHMADYQEQLTTDPRDAAIRDEREARDK
jgi:hypothetical protein